MSKIEIPLETQYSCVSILQECQSKPWINVIILPLIHSISSNPLWIHYPLSKLLSSNIVNIFGEVTGHNGHKPKRPQPKRPQTETATNRNGHRPKRPQTGTATNRNGHKPERPQTGTATGRNGHKPKRPQTGTATDRNGRISCHPPHQLSPE